MLAAQAMPKFNSNETNRHKISRIAIQILLKFNADAVRTASVVGGWVGFGAGRGATSQFKPPSRPKKKQRSRREFRELLI